MVLEERIKQAKILVVDDQEPNIMLLEKLLSRAGYNDIHTLTDSREVLDTYLKIKPDLLLLDIQMPYLDGFGVMEQLKEKSGDTYLPILVLTAQIDSETRYKALDLGAKDFLEKPFDHIEALTRIRNMLEVRLLHNQVRDQNRNLEEKVKDRTQDLIETQREILRRLCKASEYRDDDTGFHISRMSHYCELIGRAAELSAHFCDHLLDISALHDVGKIGIPDYILLKPDKLSDEEYDIMKQHTTIGADILAGSSSPILRLAESIALTHHERWDGSGYPQGLKGEDIPVEGRICAIADVFDALTSVRPYKKAWNVEAAIIEMKNGRGSHFDPFLFDKFMDILPKVLEIREKYQSSNENA